jgi:uncharacterized Ntn-hydrolase superfamily protein
VELNTFSIAARCAETGRLGVAVASAVPAVGGLCPYLRAGAGAVSTQSWVNPYLALSALGALAGGAAAPDALRAALDADEGRDLRQIGIVDAAGRAAAWTGAGCTGWRGHRTGPDYAIQGNMLVGEAVLAAMEAAFLEEGTGGDLAERLMRALERGDAAGGDKRGKQSAALRVHGQEDYAWLDVRVDEHPEPVGELRRVLGVARAQLVPFVESMPGRGRPGRDMPEAVTSMLLRPPAER